MEEEHGLTDRSIRRVMIMTMEYQQVKERVEKEDKALKQIFIRTGFGMLVALLAAIFVFR